MQALEAVPATSNNRNAYLCSCCDRVKSIGCCAGIALNETSSSGTNGFRDEVSRQISTRIYHLVSIIIVWANGVFLVMSVSNT